MTFKSVFCAFWLVLALSSSAEAEKLIFALDLIRHGDRTPIHDIPSKPYSWPQGLGQLTARGMQEAFLLGLALRKRYIETNHLLPESYHAETMYVRSSDFDRTLMTTESVLYGLYPLGTGPRLPQSKQPALPSAYQPLPIHTLPQEQDGLLVGDRHSSQYQAWVKKYIYSRRDWQQKTTALQPYFAHFNQVTGLKISSLDQIITLGDALYIRQLYHIPKPPGLTEAELHKIIESANWAFVTTFKAPPLRKAPGYQLLAAITSYLKQASQAQNKLKFVLFTSHDSTILSLLSVLRMPIENVPPYASDLNFALLETEKGEKRVRLSLNGQALAFPGCQGGECSLEQFEKNYLSKK